MWITGGAQSNAHKANKGSKSESKRINKTNFMQGQLFGHGAPSTQIPDSYDGQENQGDDHEKSLDGIGEADSHKAT